MWEILIIISLAAIFIIFIRRLPEVEIQGLPEEKQREKSKIEKILENLDNEEFEKIPSDEREVQALKNEADDYFHQRDFAKAEELYIKIAMLDPDNAQVYGRLGVIYLFNKNFSDAKEAFQAALKHENDNGFWYNNLGLALFNMKSFKAAIDAFKRSIELGGDVAARYYNLGLAYVELENLEDAEKNFQKAYELEPQNKNYVRILEGVRKKRKSG